ncbi:MAG TPA: hypothetical protein PK460_00170 [Bacilli bacterium]|nr:hypothetical protein [Bacilli bacterium]HOQ70150.1 hypothetical protein [Bacilli bacterium]
MNKKNKVLLGAIGLVLLSGIAATSSTFAWFTTVRTASISYSEATVQASDGNLAIEYLSSLNNWSGGSTYDAEANKVTIAGANKVTDISGDGKTFYKPVWTTPVSTASSIETVPTTGSPGVADGFYIDFTVRLSRDNDVDENGLKVYLGTGTTIAPKDPENLADTGAVKAARLAVIDHEGDVKVRWAPEQETEPKYITTGTDSLYGVSGFETTTDLNYKHGEITSADSKAAADLAGFLVADLSKGVATEANVTFRIWLEGEDKDCNNDILGGVFNVNIALYTFIN